MGRDRAGAVQAAGQPGSFEEYPFERATDGYFALMAQMDILELVSGLDFPISREDLVRQARERGAGNEVIAMLKSLPAEQFANADDL